MKKAKKTDEEEKKPEIKPETFPNQKRVPVLQGLPEYLKDSESYPKVQRALLETLATTHSHSDMLEWSQCFSCQEKLHEHAEMMRKLGFSSPQQYRAWVKVHEQIKNRVKLR